MLIIELTYKKSLDEVNSLLDEHRSFLDQFYSQGLFIASSPKNPRDGGVISDPRAPVQENEYV